MNCAMSTVKYILFLFNFLIMLCGIGLLIPGIMAIIEFSDKGYFLDSKYNVPSIVVTSIGGILLVVGFFGCCGAIRENSCMTKTYTSLVVLIVLAEIAVGVTAFVFREDIYDIIGTNVRKTVNIYDEDVNAAKAMDDLQRELECCGADRFSDYKRMILPQSCCSSGQECVVGSKYVYEQGCVQALSDLASSLTNVVGAIAIGVAAVEILVIIFSCCLSRSIRKQRMATV